MAHTRGDASIEASQEHEPQDPAAVEATGPVAGRHGLGRGGVIALGVAVVVLVAAIVVSLGSGRDANLPSEVTPLPGDELAEVDVVRVDGPAEVSAIDPGQLVAPVHALTATCDLVTRNVPPSSTYHVVTDAVSTAEGPTVCRAQPLSDGRMIGTVGWGSDDLRIGVIDPRRPGDGPQPAPAVLDDTLVAGSGVRVVGFVEDTDEVLVSRSTSGTDRTGDLEASLVAVDLDSGGERELLAPGTLGDPGSVIGAAQVRDGHLVVVTGEPSAMGPHVLAGLGQRGLEATRIWFGPVDGELSMVRQPSIGTDGEMVLRDLHPPRIVDGADGPLVASFEHVRGDDDWQLVLIAPDGATRVAAELGGAGEPVRSTAEPRTPRSSMLGRGTDASFDAVGSQMLIAGTVVETQTDDRDGTPTVLLLDLTEGTWSRLPVEATIATFDRTDH